MPAITSQPFASTDNAAGLPREDRARASETAEYLVDQIDQFKRRRDYHARLWLHVSAIMQGIPWYEISNGVVYPLARDKGKIRPVIPVMKSLYRTERGRLGSNSISLTASAKLKGDGSSAYSKAQRAQSALRTWKEEVDLDSQEELVNQYLLYYGTAGLHVTQDWTRQQVYLRAIPAPQIFPIPYYATDPSQLEGIMLVRLRSKTWLEMQDRSMARKYPNGKDANGQIIKKLAEHAEKQTMHHSIGTVGLADFDQYAGEFECAVTAEAWMKTCDERQWGEWFFMVNGVLCRHMAGPTREDPRNPQSKVFYPLVGSREPMKGVLPVEVIYYDKDPRSFLGGGFCGNVISLQREINRQAATVVRDANYHKPLIFYDSMAPGFDVKDIGDSDRPLIPLAFNERGAPVYVVPPLPFSQHVGMAMQLFVDAAERVSGHSSGIVYGQQEGRTEGGPATQLLNTNASAPLYPILKGKYKAYKRLYSVVLDLLKETWTFPHRINAIGSDNIGREIVLSKTDDLPWSNEVDIEPTPMIPNGSNALLQLLFQLRSMPTDAGREPIVKDHEFRKALTELGYDIPGIDKGDPVAERINKRIQLLINDTKTPAISPAGGMGSMHLQIENHRKAIELLTAKILETSVFESYSPAVQGALWQELRFHMDAMVGGGGTPPADVDNDIAEEDARAQERFLDAAEQDMSEYGSHMSLFGQPL
jgi:hypothetical protein